MAGTLSANSVVLVSYASVTININKKMKSKTELPGITEMVIYQFGGDKTIKLACPAATSVEHTGALAELAFQIIESLQVVGEKYLNLCKYIRKNQIAPRAVSEILTQMGFKKERISEVNRVSQVGEDLWKELEAKNLGFRQVLEQSRGIMPMLIEDVSGEGEGEGEGEGGEGEEKAALEEEIMMKNAAKGSKWILKAANGFGCRQKTYRDGSAYEVIVRKIKAKKGKVSAANGAIPSEGMPGVGAEE